MQKVTYLFQQITKEIQLSDVHRQFNFPEGINAQAAKISRGENYQGLPYQVLDIIKYFNGTSYFTYRVMFWWGKHFSFTLLLGGDMLDFYRDKLTKNLTSLDDADLYFCINEDPWQHHFEGDNYVLLNNLEQGDLRRLLKERTFIKLSGKVGMNPFDSINDNAITFYTKLINTIS